MTAIADRIALSGAIESPSQSTQTWMKGPRRRLLLGASVLTLVTASAVVMAPRLAHAVICENFGAGGDPAGIDGGNADNTACGLNANAGGGGISINTAVGTSANASGNTSINTATGGGADASGDDAHNVATGNLANANGDDSSNIATGFNANASGTDGPLGSVIGSANIATGTGANASGNDGRNIASGNLANASGAGSANIATGNLANASGSDADGDNDGSENIATGVQADASGDDSRNIAIGTSGNASGDLGRNVAVGAGAQAIGSGLGSVGSTAIGSTARANFDNSAAFGAFATTTRANQQVFGTASNTYTMSGITSGASKAAQRAPTHIVTSNAGGDLAAFTANQLGLATSSDVASLQRRDGELTEGIAAVAALAQPYFCRARVSPCAPAGAATTMPMPSASRRRAWSRRIS